MTEQITFTKFTSNKPLSKEYSINDAGLNKKQAAAQITNGKAQRMVMSPKGFSEALSNQPSNVAFCYGQYAESLPDKVNIVLSGKENAATNSISRTKQNFEFVNGIGVLELDYDPSEYGASYTPEGLLEVLALIYPEIASCTKIVRDSLSAGVSLANGEQSKGKGFHIYIPVKDASLIPEYAESLRQHLWAEGFGHIALSANGGMLERLPIDMAVFSPERLDFVGSPVIKSNALIYTPPEVKYIDGGLLDLSTLAEPDEFSDYSDKIATAKLTMTEQAKAKKEEWAAAKLAVMIANGSDEDQAKTDIEAIVASEGKDLYGSFILYFADGLTPTVSEVLLNHDDYNGKALADPFEGVAYGKTTAKFYWNNGKPVVNSNAHGGAKYFLHTDVLDDFTIEGDVTNKSVQSTHNDILDSSNNYQNVDLLKHLPDDCLIKKMARFVAIQTNLPESTVLLAGLSVFSSVAARESCVAYQNGQPLPIGLYSVLEQPSGTGKSRCLEFFQRPFNAQLRTYSDELSNKILELERSATKADDVKDEIAKLRNIKKRLALFITNATSEGLEKTLATSYGYFSAASSEQGLFDSLLGKSYNTGSNNNDIVLNGFDGGYVSTARATREGYVGPVIGGICTFAQYGSIETLLSASNGTGLSERFLKLTENHALGTRDHLKKVNSSDEGVLADYEKVCGFVKSVVETPTPLQSLPPIIISDQGHVLINTYRNKIERHLADGGKYSHISMRGAASKVNMQIMKIAANLFLLDSNVSFFESIPLPIITASINIANDLLEANLRLCMTKDILGTRAEFTSILSLFEKDSRPRSERTIITSKVSTKPFNEVTGNKSDKIRETLNEMVLAKLLAITQAPSGPKLYSMSQ